MANNTPPGQPIDKSVRARFNNKKLPHNTRRPSYALFPTADRYRREYNAEIDNQRWREAARKRLKILNASSSRRGELNGD